MIPLQVLHAVRLKGFADSEAVAARYGRPAEQTAEDLLDAEAYGWVTRSSFAGVSGWSLTEAGRRQNETQLSAELDEAGVRDLVEKAHDEFLPLNAEATHVLSTWQLGTGELRHADVYARLGGLGDQLRALEEQLTAALSRFAGYHARFTAALAGAATDPVWITGLEVDSCHRVWFELHEDLVATLGLTR